MSVPVARRIVVGVDFSAESASALRWACREASLRGAEVHAVHAREAQCHSIASYAVPACDQPQDVDADVMWRSIMPDLVPGVRVRTEVAEGLAARILLDRSEGADMLILGTASDAPETMRSAGPVIRACLRRALCPVVVISVAQEPLPRHDAGTDAAAETAAAETAEAGGDVQMPVRLPVGAQGPGGIRVPAPSAVGVPAAPAKGVPVPAGA